MVTFADDIHPKLRVTVRFDYHARAIQYLEYFKIINTYPTYEFFPLNLKFNSYDELNEFIVVRGIIYYETDHNKFMGGENHKLITVVDSRRIYDVEESIAKYLLSYKYYSVNELAEMLSFSRPTIYKFINEQSLPALRINGQLRINHLDMIEFMNKENQK